MKFDKTTQQAIKERMQELNKDQEFKAQLDKEVAPLKGRNIRKYITEAGKKSENEVR